MIKKIIVLLLFAGASVIAYSQQLIPMDTAIRYGKLDNGLTYYIRLNNEPEGRADFYIVQNVGAILEEDHQNGLAHFLEHMAFNGTKNFPDKGIINYIENIGGQFGRNVNAYTSLDETVYMLRNIPSSRQSIIDSCLLVLHDWSSFISLEDKEIDNERGVILEEWRTGAKANRRMWKESNKLKYPDSQYAKRDVIGDTAVINNFSYEALRSYYKKWYRPDLQAIVIVGEVDVDEVEKSIKQIFNDIPKSINPAERIIYTVADNREPIISIVTDLEAEFARIGLEYKKTAANDEYKKTEKHYTDLVRYSLITSMLSARFNENTTKPDASYVGAYANYGQIARLKDAFQAMVVPKEGLEKKAFEDMLVELERMRRYGFTADELSRTKKKVLASLEKAYNERDKTKSASYVREYTGHFLDLEPIPGIKWELEKTRQLFENEITLEELNKKAQALITEENLIVDITAPYKEGVKLPTREELLDMLIKSKTTEVVPYKEDIITEALFDETIKPGTLLEEKSIESLEIDEWKLSNGIKVLFKSTTNKADEIQFSAFSDGGISKVKKTKDLPSAYFATDIVENNGLDDFSAIDLKKMLAGKVVAVSPYISSYSEGMKGYSSIKDFETLLQLVHLYFTEPRKDKEAYASLISQYKTALANVESDPNKSFRDSVNWLSKNKHPRTVLLNTKLIEKVNQHKALKIYKERFKNPADFTFVFVGNINKDSVKSLILNYLGGLKTTNKKEKWVDNGFRYPKGKNDCEFEKEMQVSKTSVYYLLTQAMPYSFENKVHLGALADILDIRYTESIREKEGGTYGVRVSAGLTNQPVEQSSLSIQFDTDATKKDKLISLVFQELDSIVSNGPKEVDLIKVKKNLLKQHEENLEENSWWLSSIRLYEEDAINYVEDFPVVVANLNGKAIQEIAKVLLKDKNVLSVIMKSKESIKQ